MNYVKTALLAAGLSFGASAAIATPSLSFIVDGDTFTSAFSFSNASDDNETLLAFGIDLTGSASGACFDLDQGDFVCARGGGTDFTPQGGTDITTGLLTSNVVNGGTTLDLTFDDFDAGETFSFVVDVDDAAGATVTGDELIGATAFADFSNGLRLIGEFEAVAGNSDASAFNVSAIVVTPPSVVPLPAGLPLLAVGLGAFGLLRRRKAQSA